MAGVKAIRQAIAANLDTITGLHVAYRVPEVISSPPLAVVMPPSVEFDAAMACSLDKHEYRVVVFCGRFDSIAAEDLLDAYATSTGATSIKTAIESDRTLGGLISDLRVTSMREVGPMPVGDSSYLTATFLVSVATI